ncbi:MAG: hypothetical protein HYS27_17675 [Deltaproteobacteria bacterium]|nr:hypothetical protein [Deltaproteobacteria bacterium]
MVDFDPIEGLVALGVVTREQAAAAERVPLWVSASRVGRLVHAGVDVDELLRALSTLTGISVASRELIQRAERFQLPQHLVRKLRDLTACPVRRDPDGTVHLLVADPSARDDVARQLLNFRVYLASEVEVRGLLEHLWPLGTSMEGAAVLDGDTEPGEPTLSDSQPPDMPMPPPRTATPLPAPRTATPPPAPPRRSTPPPAPPRAPTPPPVAPTAPPRLATPSPVQPGGFGGFHMELPSTSPGGLGHGESVLRTVAKSVERPWEPASDAGPPRPAPFNLNAPRGHAEAPPPKPTFAEQTVEQTIEETVEETLRLPASPSAAEPTFAAPKPLPTPQARGGVLGVQAAEAPSGRRSFMAGGALGVIATLVIVALVVAGVLLLRGGDSAEDVRAKQELLFANARASAEKSDHAWAVAKCDQVIDLDPTTHVAAAALVLRGRERLTLGDREGLEDLRSALRALSTDDPLYAEAKRAVAAAEHSK